MKIDYYKDTYSYFKKINPAINTGTLLDYGCNYGTFLDSSRGEFSQFNYTGIDVDVGALDAGRKMFPNATFVESYQFNEMYNQDGILDRPLIGYYDNIISYSVLTHTSKEDFVDTLAWLYEHLSPGGKMMITYLDVEHSTTNQFFYNKRIKDFGFCDPIISDSYVYLNNNLVQNDPVVGQFLLLFWHNTYLIENVLCHYNEWRLHENIPAKNCFQSCIEITKS